MSDMENLLAGSGMGQPFLSFIIDSPRADREGGAGLDRRPLRSELSASRA